MRARGLVVILYVFVAVVMLGLMTSFVEQSNQISEKREVIMQQQEELHRRGQAMMRANGYTVQP